MTTNNEKETTMNGLEFKALRAYHNLSVESVSELFNVNIRTIRRWENDAHPIPPGLTHEWEEINKMREEIVNRIWLGSDPEQLLSDFPNGYPPGLVRAAWGEFLVHTNNDYEKLVP